jgi:flagellar basal-body rod protein FlgB
LAKILAIAAPAWAGKAGAGSIMELNQITLFAAFKRKLDWAAERQQLLAQNVANADTPGYRAKDLKAVEFKELLRNPSGPVRLAVTDPKHIARTTGGTARHRVEGATIEVAPSGNAVVLEEQMLKVRNTAGKYAYMLDLMDKHMSFLKLALRRPR